MCVCAVFAVLNDLNLGLFILWFLLVYSFVRCWNPVCQMLNKNTHTHTFLVEFFDPISFIFFKSLLNKYIYIKKKKFRQNLFFFKLIISPPSMPRHSTSHSTILCGTKKNWSYFCLFDILVPLVIFKYENMCVSKLLRKPIRNICYSNKQQHQQKKRQED